MQWVHLENESITEVNPSLDSARKVAVSAGRHTTLRNGNIALVMQYVCYLLRVNGSEKIKLQCHISCSILTNE